MADSKQVYFVRHGEAEGNKYDFSQSPSTPLTATGRQQAVALAKRFSSLPVDRIISSTMKRAQDTAQYLGDAKGLPVETVDWCHETLKAKSLAGQSRQSTVYQDYLQNERANWANPNWRYEDGENFADILARVERGITWLEAQPETAIVVCTHGRFLRVLVSYLLHQKQLTAELELQTAAVLQDKNTGITWFTNQGQEWQLITWNDHASFAEA